MAGHTKNKPRWGDGASIEGLLESQEDAEAEEDRLAAEGDASEAAYQGLTPEQFAEQEAAYQALTPEQWGERERALSEQRQIEKQEALRVLASLRPPGTGPGREFAPTPEQREMVKNMARCGMPHESMTLMVHWPNGRPISVRTLRKCFRDELIKGHIEVGMQYVGALYKRAMAGDTGAIIFGLKTGYGFRETVHQEITGKDGAPLQAGVTGVIAVPGMIADAETWEKMAADQQSQLVQRAAEIVSGSSS